MQICDYYGICGGCRYKGEQNLQILEEKILNIYNIILKSKISLEIDKISYETSENPYFYRNRMDFPISQEKKVGLRKRGKFHSIVPLDQCLIANEKINNIIKQLNQLLQKSNIEIFDVVKREGALRYAVIRAPEFIDNNTITFIVNKNYQEKEKILSQLNKISDQLDNIKNILVGYVKYNTDVSVTNEFEILKGNKFLQEKLNNIVYSYHSQGFFQVNSKIAEKMLIYVNSLLEKSNNSILIDLFGGIGTFGINLHKHYEKVYIIDNNESNIEAAKYNAKLNNLSNIFPVMLDAKNISFFYNQNIQHKDIDIIIDPPRAGLHKNTIKFIKELLPNKIIYISCNPKNFSQELFYLKDYYSITNAKAFDMFPNTNHIEIILELSRKRA